MPSPAPALPGASEGALRFVANVLGVAARYHRLDVFGLEHVPDGPALLVGNHSGGGAPVDALFLAHFYERFGYGEPVFILAHDAFFRVPGAADFLEKLGLLRARPDEAERALAAGRKVLVFPGSDFDALRPFRDRKRVIFNGHKGFARIAEKLGAPIVPVASAGGHEAFVVLAQGLGIGELLGLHRRFRWHSFPAILCLPWILAIGPLAYLPYFPLPSKITVTVGAPIFPRDVADVPAGAERVDALYSRTIERLQASLTAMYASRRWPIVG